MTSRDQILSLFRRHQGVFLSGRQICQELKISRAAVWKQVEGLRQDGFSIEAQRSKGYRLVDGPDLLLADEVLQGLHLEQIGRPLICLELLDSTNARARQLGEGNGADGTVIIADRQSAGRGRLGRRWESPPGVNLYTSILLRPAIPVQQAPQLTFLTAVSVAEALHQTADLQPQVKWPNDVLVGGKKIAGLLNEMNAETERIHFVVLGVGVNLNMTADQFPEELNYPATSVLLETGRPVSRSTFARAFLEQFDYHYSEFLVDGFGPIRRRWESLCEIINRRVRVDLSPGQLEGTVVGLEPDGALRLQCDNGKIEHILAGDVRPL